MSEWQPIETAPVNKWVLVYSANRNVRVAWCEVKDGLRIWRKQNMNSKPTAWKRATHWMLLPEPPGASRK